MSRLPVKKISIFLITISYSLFASSEAACPDADIRPCTCDDEGLRCLNLNNSGLERVFSSPAERKAIRRVWIFQTNLTELPKQAFGNYIIRDLYLDLNQINHINTGAFGEAAKTLQLLSLTRNQLVTFPFEDMAYMKKLKQIDLGYNQIKKLESYAFPASETLEFIDLSHNLIETIEPYAFAKLTEVSLIDLSRNQLRSIEKDALLVSSSTRNLMISLRGNHLTKIAMDAFGGHHPNSIDLSRNQLKYLDQATFEPLLANNTAILVEENPFSCSGCELYRWLIELDKSSRENLINFSCADETKLEDLTPEIIGCSNNNSDQLE